MQEQLAELSKQLTTVGLEDEFEDEVSRVLRAPAAACSTRRRRRPNPNRLGTKCCGLDRPAALCSATPLRSRDPYPPTPRCQYEEWEDPSGGLLSDVFDACENEDADALGALLDKLAASEWGINAHGPDGDTPL